MRSAAIVAILVASTALLAGCSAKKDTTADNHEYVCKNATSTVTIDLEKYPEHHNATFNPASKCPGAKGSSSGSNTTSQAPNKLPILKLMIMSGGNMTNVTMLNGNLTFDATGSMDPDGQVTGVAVTVKDSNQTRTAALFDPVKKSFKPVTFKFDRPGVVNVTVAMVDDRAGFTINQTHVYVDQTIKPTSQTINQPGGGGPAQNSACDGGNPLVSANYFKQFDFPLVAGATMVEAMAETHGASVPGAGESPSGADLTVCGPDLSILSETGNPTVTKAGTALPPAKGTDSYFVSATAPLPDSDVTVIPTILVHYEPNPVATLKAAA